MHVHDVVKRQASPPNGSSRRERRDGHGAQAQEGWAARERWRIDPMASRTRADRSGWRRQVTTMSEINRIHELLPWNIGRPDEEQRQAA
jgi:hypothetical protein